MEKVSRKRWNSTEIKLALAGKPVPGRTRSAINTLRSKFGKRTKNPWTDDEIKLVMAGGFPKGRTANAVYQARHKLKVPVALDRRIDPKHPNQLELDLPAVRKNAPQHHYESVAKLLKPIYTMFNAGMNVDEIVKEIGQSKEFVSRAIDLKKEFTQNGKSAK